MANKEEKEKRESGKVKWWLWSRELNYPEKIGAFVFSVLTGFKKAPYSLLADKFAPRNTFVGLIVCLLPLLIFWMIVHFFS